MVKVGYSNPAVWMACASAVTVATALLAWWRWARPRLKRWNWERQAKNDVLIGRPAVLDSITGKELAPPLPGVGVRMDLLTETVAKLADTHLRIENHEERIKVLEEATVERVVTRAESAQAYRAIEAAINATPDEDV